MYLLEVSWEVCNEVGGNHTVITTKAASLVQAHGDKYVTFGPWLNASAGASEAFEPEAGHEALIEACRRVGVPIRVGRWSIPARPRAILVGFSELFAQKDVLLAKLWEHYRVDSLFGGWDYVEPVLFSHAVALVIEQMWHLELGSSGESSVAQFHEWMTGAGALHLKRKVPGIATVFTTHATILGRSLASGGTQPQAGLEGRTPEQAADQLGIRAKHSLESISAPEADVFTTVSAVTALEATRFAMECVAGLLVLFHHHPDRSDEQMDAIVQECRELVAYSGSSLRVIAAWEGLTLTV